MNENMSIVYTFGYLVKKYDKKFLKLEIVEQDEVIDSGLIIGPYSNSLSKAYFVR